MFALLKDKVSQSLTFPEAKLIQLEGDMFECNLELHQYELILRNRACCCADESLSGQTFCVDNNKANINN